MNLSETLHGSWKHLLDILHDLFSKNVDGTELHLSLGISTEDFFNKDGWYMGFSEAALVTTSCETIFTGSVNVCWYLLDNLNFG